MAKLSYRKAHERAEADLDKAQGAIFAAGPDRNTPFWQCYELASLEAKSAYDNSLAALDNARIAAISAGKAWQSAVGRLLYWY